MIDLIFLPRGILERGFLKLGIPQGGVPINIADRGLIPF